MPRLLTASLVFSVLVSAHGAFSLGSPEAFFTNVADRLLQQQLGTRLSEIQIAPTNQYDSAVHRIFQVTANIYDATSTNEFPTVFRPLFNVTSNGVFLDGFTNDNSANTLQSWLDSNPYGIPMVIAARKGFPNFNEFTLRTDVLVQRKLQLSRPAIFSLPIATNQMYVLSLSNYFGVESWNSSAWAYPRAVTLMVSNWAALSMTNDFGMQTNGVATYSTVTNIPANSWLGDWSLFPLQSLVLGLNTNGVFLSNAVYRFAENRFVNSSTNAFELIAGFPLPYWIFTISNRLTYVLLDGNRIIDFVWLDSTSPTDLYRDLVATDPYQGISGASAILSQVWATNRSRGATGPTDGILHQLDIGLGHLQTVNSEWRTFGLNTSANESQKNSLIDSFRVFCGLQPLYAFVTNNALEMQAPFNPAARLVILNTWQVNDPLVHYHPADFNAFGPAKLFFRPLQPGTNISPASVGFLNDCYSPWAGNPTREIDPSSLDRALRDPGVYSANDWNFPANETFSSHWLGRIHRGTPWQTIYLKADVAPLTVWTNQSRSLATNSIGQLYSPTHPTNDWRMVELLASLFRTNDVRALTSINETNADVWMDTFSGLTVLSNTATAPQIYLQPTFMTNSIADDAPQLVTIMEEIRRRRTERRGEYFPAVADFLAVPELSSASPWLNIEPPQDPQHPQRNFGLTDAAYEILPSQLLSLVRADPVGTITHSGNTTHLSFLTFDGYAHRIEATKDFVTWANVSEPHYSTNGVLRVSLPINGDLRFFRAVLLP